MWTNTFVFFRPKPNSFYKAAGWYGDYGPFFEDLFLFRLNSDVFILTNSV